MNCPEVPASPPGFGSYEMLMALALEEAKAAAQAGEVPVGAALIDSKGTVLARAGNSLIQRNDPTAHAEILCLRQAAETIGNYRLEGTILAVTLEPCLMCLGAMVHARIAGLVYGATDPRTGAVASQLRGPELPFLNHRFWVKDGVLAEDCSRLLREFFQARR